VLRTHCVAYDMFLESASTRVFYPLVHHERMLTRADNPSSASHSVSSHSRTLQMCVVYIPHLRLHAFCSNLPDEVSSPKPDLVVAAVGDEHGAQ